MGNPNENRCPSIIYLILFGVLTLGIIFAICLLLFFNYSTENKDICILLIRLLPRVLFLAVLFWPFFNKEDMYWPPLFSLLCIEKNNQQPGNSSIFKIVALLVVALAMGITPTISF
ncbi:MAG: hypothetical protein LBD08_04670 [Treponema sp.]|jgi:hypothetical protein|nr:hypothetical protein [Treponema sp.]